MYIEVHVGNATLPSAQKSEMGGESVWWVGKVGGTGFHIPKGSSGISIVMYPATPIN